MYCLKAVDSEDQTLFTSTIDQPSGKFFLYKNVSHCIDDGPELKCDLNLKFPCWSKCGKMRLKCRTETYQILFSYVLVNSDNQSCATTTGASCKEQARDVALDIVLVEITDTCVIERSPSTISIPIWVKVMSLIYVVIFHCFSFCI